MNAIRFFLAVPFLVLAVVAVLTAGAVCFLGGCVAGIASAIVGDE